MLFYSTEMERLNISHCHLLVCFFVASRSLTLMQAMTPDPEELSGSGSFVAPEISGMENNALRDLVVSGVTDHSLSVSWYANTGAYTSFVVEYKEVSLAAGSPAETFLPRDSLGAVIEGLQANTSYKIKVYGLAGEQRSPPLEAVATTGTSFLLLTKVPQSRVSLVKGPSQHCAQVLV